MTNQERATQYANLMEEIKFRVEAIYSVIRGSVRLRFKIAEEFCYLQLRIICETIALGCLLIHGDIKETQTNKLQKEWSADRIMKTLERLHPTFFPVPLQARDIPEKPPIAVDKKSGFLTKAEFFDLYSQAGAELHRGTLTTILSKPRTTFRDIGAAWASD